MICSLLPARTAAGCDNRVGQRPLNAASQASRRPAEEDRIAAGADAGQLDQARRTVPLMGIGRRWEDGDLVSDRLAMRNQM